MISLSPDGYVRLTFRELINLQLHHIYTEADGDIVDELRAQGVPVRHAGVSEWCSNTEPAISLGITYFVDGQDGTSQRLHLAPEPIRGNVMLIDAKGYDLGPDNPTMLRLWGELYGWRESISLNDPVTH